MDGVPDGSMLAGTRLFAGLDAAARDEIAASCHVVRLSVGETQFEQDDTASAFCGRGSDASGPAVE